MKGWSDRIGRRERSVAILRGLFRLVLMGVSWLFPGVLVETLVENGRDIWRILFLGVE